MALQSGCGRWRQSAALLPVAWLVTLLQAGAAHAQERTVCVAGAPGAPSVYIDSSASEVVVVTIEGRELSAARNLLLCPGDEVRTGATGRVAIRFEEKRTVIRLDGNSRTRVLSGGTGSADVSLLSGILYFVSSVRRHFEVETPYIVAGIDGTEALVTVQPAGALATAAVREGLVSAYDREYRGTGVLAVSGGEAAFRSAVVPFQSAPIADLPPPFRDLLIVSDSAVDWAVYYPPILLVRDARHPAIREALILLSSGDHDRADAALDNAGAEPAASAALRAIIAVARNRIAEAERWSRLALEADPGFAPAHVAASYVRQAVGDLDGALDLAEAAAALAPGDAYVLARLAELRMTIGDRRAALAGAEASLAIERLPLALFVAGLAQLSAARYEAAEALFAEAIEIDPEAPLPRLGLGLAFIRQGRTAAGAWEIERAVAHDPRRASLRTWLGRAYFDEDLAAKAAEELRIAKEEDPEDPTPYLFSALERFAANQPIDALRELQEAEARGRARGVIRSESGLQEDAATRGAALGRIYDILGFEQMAINEGTKAAARAPASPAAHRFLADAYRSRREIEIAQTSELLRSQLLSPPSKTPVQPQVAETGLALLDTAGPARVTFAEFSPLFDSDGFRLDAFGLLGTQETLADEAAATLLYRGFSFSLGQFHYETDGYHANNQVDHDVLNAVTTLSVTPWFDLFGEYRWRNTQSGDRRVLFDLDDFSETAEIDFEREVFRLGFHAMPGVGHDVLGLFSHGTLDTATFEDVPPFGSTTDTDETIDEGQFQYIGQRGRHSLQLGGSVSHVEGGKVVGILSDFGDFFVETPIDADQANAYGYATLFWPDAVEWTLGMSVDHVDNEGAYTRTRVNPKLGVRANLTDDITIRAAYLQTLKRRLVADQTLEPTAIAGFTQFFDTFNGTAAERIGAGLDVRLAENLWVGGEATRDDMDVPSTAGSNIDENRIGGYLNATFGDFAIAFSPSWERLEADALFVVDELDTLELPLMVSYFREGGLFGSVRGSFVVQDGEEDAERFSDEFFVLDAVLGYRFPHQRGVASIEARNILDSNFGFFEQSLVDDLTAEPRFARERTVLGRITLRF